MIEFNHVSKTFGDQQAVSDLNLHFSEGSFSVLIGTSGSGKSTTLKMINRLVEHDSGTIRFAGEEIRSLPVLELRRRMGYAIQSIGLFPHWTVAQNIATVPQLQKWSRARINDRIDELMALLGLESVLRDRYPHQLSGGQQQRVGVARALAADPQVLLMDEPFGALDPVTRGALQQEMTRIHRLLGRTIVLVTHDIDEALRLADHLVLMDGGNVIQQGSPLSMLTSPENDFVQAFFGRSELGVRLLSLRSVGDYVRRHEQLSGDALVEEMTLRDALSMFVARRCDVLPVANQQGEPCGTLHFRDLLSETSPVNDCVIRFSGLLFCSCFCCLDCLIASRSSARCFPICRARSTNRRVLPPSRSPISGWWASQVCLPSWWASAQGLRSREKVGKSFVPWWRLSPPSGRPFRRSRCWRSRYPSWVLVSNRQLSP